MRGTGVQEEQERDEPLHNGRVSSSVVFLVQLHPFTRSAGSVSSSPCHGWTAAISELSDIRSTSVSSRHREMDGWRNFWGQEVPKNVYLGLCVGGVPRWLT